MAFALASPGHAQSAYPSKFIKIIVGYAAGDGTDVVARVVGDKLSERLGQPVVVENKPRRRAARGICHDPVA
jgi:tripartite-type tricarboxylate transporter receptor subunit TctC